MEEGLDGERSVGKGKETLGRQGVGECDDRVVWKCAGVMGRRRERVMWGGIGLCGLVNPMSRLGDVGQSL